MANPYVTGPVHLYVAAPQGIGSSSSSSSSSSGSVYTNNPPDPLLLAYPSMIYYLGTCETAPKIVIDPKWKPLFADIGGDQVPFDFAYTGEDATVTGVLNRWNEYVYRSIVARPNTTVRGTLTANDVGSLMIAEGKAHCLWLHFPYYSKAYGSTYNMPAGYRFPASFVIGPDHIEGGTKASKRLIQWKCARTYKPSDGTWLIYDHTMTYIPSSPPTYPTGAIS